MIPKKNRIKREDFEEITKKGGFLSSSLFSIRFLKNPEKIRRISVVVSKKVAKTAVKRNLLRRRVYEVIQKMPESPYFSIIFAKKGSEKASFREIATEITKLLKNP